MRLGRLRARGLKGLAHLDAALDLDFRTLPDGLIAIVGENGAGKSTLLEAPFAALFGEFPSRPDCKLLDSVDGRDAFLDVEVAVDGRGTYRARVNVDGVKRTTDAVLELTRPGGAVDRLNDGKVSTFHPAVARELPPKALLLASIFAAQNKAGSFAKLERREQRELLAKLLGLERYEQMATTARAAASLLDKTLIDRRAVRDRLAPQVTPAIEAAFEATGNDLQAELAAVEDEREQLGQTLRDLTAEIDGHRVNAARYTAATAERAHLTRQIETVQATRDRLRHDAEALTVDLERELGTITAASAAVTARIEHALADLSTDQQLEDELTVALREIDSRLEAAIATRDQRIANNRDLLDRADAIRAAAAELARHQRALVEQEHLRTEAERVGSTLETVRDRTREDLQGAERAREHRDRLVRTKSLMDQVPCGGAGKYGACQFLQDARDAEAQLGALADVDILVDRAKSNRDVAQARLNANREQSTAYRQAIDAARAGIAGAQADATLLPRLEAAQARVADLEAEQAQLRTDAERDRQLARDARTRAATTTAQDRVELMRDRHNEALALDQAIHEAKHRYGQKVDALDARLQATYDEQQSTRSLVTALDAIAAETATAHEALVAATARETTARQRWDTSSHRLARLQADIATFQQRRVDFRALKDEFTTLDARIAQIETERIEWAAFATIFGREGLPVLEIDAAGPGVSALANDLLQACFGSRFQVELVTQDAKADGRGMKEVLELRVYDAERGGEARALQLLSGGEQVIVDEAIRAAVSLFINQRSDMPLRTIFRDETTGALDPDNAQRYVAMLRRLLERSGAEKLLFISHNPDAAALADAQIVLAGGTLDVRYPPFAASEAA